MRVSAEPFIWFGHVPRRLCSKKGTVLLSWANDQDTRLQNSVAQSMHRTACVCPKYVPESDVRKRILITFEDNGASRMVRLVENESAGVKKERFRIRRIRRMGCFVAQAR